LYLAFVTGILFYYFKLLFMNMYVSNLSFHTTDETLRALFAPFGNVTSAKVITDRESGQSRGFGFVEMDVVAEGQEAIKSLNNKEIEGRPLSVSVAKERAPRTFNKRW
jgi:RNA recognition motif-containing protein